LVSVPIYPSTPAQPCGFVLDDSGAGAVIAEDAQQAAKLRAFF
jgi:long-subunit acyl-CoA synthetase (AMP-forming)